MSVKDYTPPPSVVPFLTADKFANFIVGPVGSTKTTAAIMKIAMEAAKVAPCHDGIRRSRCAVIRNTRQMLFDTTIPDFLKWFPDGQAGVMMKTESKFLMKFNDIECEVLFRGLDDANDVRRLLAMQLTFGYMDEFREINPDIYNALTGRLGRYPDKSMNGVGACDDNGVQIDKVWGATNPPDADTFWEDLLTNPPDNTSVVFQPSGLSPEADWLQYLKDGYYDNLAEGKSEEWVDVYVHGKFGRSLAGRPVWRCFDPLHHVAKEELAPVGAGTIIIGMDAGLNPTGVLTQQLYDGRVIVTDAVTGHKEGMGALRFSREILKPLLARRYSACAFVIVLDPAAFARTPGDEKSVADILKTEGFKVIPAKTNTLAARLAVVEGYLTRTVAGKSAILISPHCTSLIQAVRSKYRYKIKRLAVSKEEQQDDTPEKLHPWSDYADALQYACLQHDGGRTFGQQMSKRRPVTLARAVGWT